jgi:hypothetical protein
MFPDVAEALSLGHLARGDATSAMVAGEWYMRNGHFPGWARPYEFCADLYRRARGLPGLGGGAAGAGVGGKPWRMSASTYGTWHAGAAAEPPALGAGHAHTASQRACALARDAAPRPPDRQARGGVPRRGAHGAAVAMVEPLQLRRHRGHGPAQRWGPQNRITTTLPGVDRGCVQGLGVGGGGARPSLAEGSHAGCVVVPNWGGNPGVHVLAGHTQCIRLRTHPPRAPPRARAQRNAGTPSEVRWFLSEEATAQRTGAVTGLNYREPKSPIMAALEEAEAALDMVAGGAADGGWDGALAEVAAAYERAGLVDAAGFIRAA